GIREEWIILKRMREIVADSIRATPAYHVEIIVEENAHRAHRGTWHVRSRLPASRKRTTKTNDARWVLLLRLQVRMPLCQCKWDDTNGHKQHQVKRTSNKMCLTSMADALLHFACAPVTKSLLLEARQRCRGFFCG